MTEIKKLVREIAKGDEKLGQLEVRFEARHAEALKKAAKYDDPSPFALSVVGSLIIGVVAMCAMGIAGALLGGFMLPVLSGVFVGTRASRDESDLGRAILNSLYTEKAMERRRDKQRRKLGDLRAQCREQLCLEAEAQNILPEEKVHQDLKEEFALKASALRVTEQELTVQGLDSEDRQGWLYLRKRQLGEKADSGIQSGIDLVEKFKAQKADLRAHAAKMAAAGVAPDEDEYADEYVFDEDDLLSNAIHEASVSIPQHKL